MSIWERLQRTGFKKMLIVFLVLTAGSLLMIYAACGTFYKVDCHEVILYKIPRGF